MTEGDSFKVGRGQQGHSQWELTVRRTLCQNTNLHEHFPNDDIIIILEHCAEDHCDSVFLRFKVPENDQKGKEEITYENRGLSG